MNIMDKFIENLKKHERAVEILKKYGLNEGLGSYLIGKYFTINDPSNSIDKICSKRGLHRTTVLAYYRQFSLMLESEFNYLLDFYYDIKMVI